MVKLPPYPLKIEGVDEDHPFVAEALRSRKHYEPCWCGSGQKYKRCHRLREQQEPLTLGQLLHEQELVFWKSRGCMHAHASPATCDGRVIDSHTIQRKGPLERIVDANNHVCRLAPARQGGMALEEVGWRQASVFPGYCARHDSVTFAPLERTPFTGTHEQCVLQSYRSVCNELYKKKALLESLNWQRDKIDRGVGLDAQINRQLSIWQSIAGQTKSKEELEQLWLKYEDAITAQDYNRFSSKCYFFQGDLCVTSSAALHAEFDFSGNKLVDMWDLSNDAEALIHSIMSIDRGGAVVFTWLRDQNSPAAVVESFEAIPTQDRGDIFVQYCFLNCENTYFSRAWWDRLNPQYQEQLKRYASMTYYEGGAFVANPNRLVDWVF